MNRRGFLGASLGLGQLLPWLIAELVGYTRSAKAVGGLFDLSFPKERSVKLTDKERVFCDHFDFESRDLTKPDIPAHEWLKAHGLREMEIWEILIARGRERTTNLPEKPEEPFALAWETAEEARRRNREMLQETTQTNPKRVS